MLFAVGLFAQDSPLIPSTEAISAKFNLGKTRIEAKTHEFWDKENMGLFAGVCGGRMLDYASTRHMRSQGRDEVLLSNGWWITAHSLQESSWRGRPLPSACRTFSITPTTTLWNVGLPLPTSEWAWAGRSTTMPYNLYTSLSSNLSTQPNRLVIRGMDARAWREGGRRVLSESGGSLPLRSQPSAAGGRTRFARAFATGRGERRENLLGPAPSALRAIGQSGAFALRLRTSFSKTCPQ